MRFILVVLLCTSTLFAEELLFVVHAKRGVYSEEKRRLILEDLDQSVTYFTQPPQRRAGKVGLQTFLTDILTQKKKMHAGFVYYSDAEHYYSDIALNLLEPLYDQVTHTLTFTVEVLSETMRLEREMDEVNLFIDHVQHEGSL